MPICAGCSAVYHEDSDCIAFSGSGSSVDPLTALPILDPNPENTLSCGPAGLLAESGGGCNLGYTVATPGIELIPGTGTPEPFLSCADFVGDGVDDSAAAQAAIDLAASAGTFNVPEVFLFPGLHLWETPVDTKGVRLTGLGKCSIGALTTGRMIDNTTSGAGVDLRRIEFLSGGGGAILYVPGLAISSVHDCQFLGGTSLAGDLADLYFPAGNTQIFNCRITNQAAETVDSVYLGVGGEVTNNVFAGAGIYLFETIAAIVQHNRFQNIGVNGGTPRDCCIGIFGNGHGNSIIGNTINACLRHGILVDGTGGGQFHNLIQSNMITNYDSANSGNYDGIHLRDGASDTNVQLNDLRNGGAVGFAINVATADCIDNWCTNNSLNLDGFQDLGTLTITTAGNRP